MKSRPTADWCYATMRATLAAADGVPDDHVLASLCLFEDSELRVFYAPFDHINAAAKIVLMGITPGVQQASIAIAAAQRLLRAGADDDQVLREAKATAAFAGTMRSNLIRMLDAVGFASVLRRPSSSSLFDQDAGLLHATSALRYPVLRRGENYTGHAPKMAKLPFFRDMMDRVLTPELQEMDSALVVPLGPAAEVAIDYIEARGKIDPERVLRGMPHPSGANNGRIAAMLRDRSHSMRTAVERWAVRRG